MKDPLGLCRSYGAEFCQPCGECEWCQAQRRYRKLALRARRLLRATRNALVSDLTAAGWDEVKQHPTLRSRDRLLSRINRLLKEMEPPRRVKKT